MDIPELTAAKEELRQLIATADQYRQRKRFDKAARTWRDEIIPRVDDIFDGDSNEIFEEKLSIRNEFSSVLTDAGEYDEAEDCDASLESLLDSNGDLYETGLGLQIANDMQDRITRRKKAAAKTSQARSKATAQELSDDLKDSNMTAKRTRGSLGRPLTNKEPDGNLDVIKLSPARIHSAPKKKTWPRNHLLLGSNRRSQCQRQPLNLQYGPQLSNPTMDHQRG
jgi:hypothetical protein